MVFLGFLGNWTRSCALTSSRNQARFLHTFHTTPHPHLGHTMSSPPVYHEVLTPKKGIKEVKEGIPRSPLVKSPARDSPLLSASVPVATLKKASPKRPAGSLNYLDSLRALPEVRPIPWMPGKELPPDKSTESPRTQTKSAFLLSTRGKINDPPCNHCTSGVGRFLHCITLEGWFHGACATCQMGTRGNLCSLRSDGGGGM